MWEKEVDLGFQQGGSGKQPRSEAYLIYSGQKKDKGKEAKKSEKYTFWQQKNILTRTKTKQDENIK